MDRKKVALRVRLSIPPRRRNRLPRRSQRHLFRPHRLHRLTWSSPAGSRLEVDSNFAKCEDSAMRIVSRKAIRDATAKHKEWGASLNAWYKIAKDADWANFADVRNSWRRSDVVDRFVVFDISHNKCRLVATIKYRWKMIYIRYILSHAEYDQREWRRT
jgi:mRNA interferase HigB